MDKGLGVFISQFFQWLVKLYTSVKVIDVPAAAWAVLAATAALLAFIVSLYTLVGSERKAPYIINKAFGIFLWSLIAGAFDAVAGITSWRAPLFLGAAILVVCFILSFVQVWRIARRFIQLNDSLDIKYNFLFRFVKKIRRQNSTKKPYEYNALNVPPENVNKIRQGITAAFPNTNILASADDAKVVSIAFALKHHDQANRALSLLAAEFLISGHYVQYMTASRHPIEFIEYLSEYFKGKGDNLAQYVNQLIVVDAYTPHFGFVDSIYDKATRAITSDHNVECLKSGISYAGIHSASGKAFNSIKGKSAKNAPRKPTAVIYENMYALADLESPEQYRVFLRHVLPSERLWGGMFTVFSEVSPDDVDWKILSSYASLNVDLRSLP